MVYSSPCRSNLVLAALTIATASLIPAGLQASGTPAGIVIENTAEATYEDGGVARTATSNAVQVLVDELLNVTATSLDSGPVTARSGPAVLSFQITNSGNGPEAFSLEAVTAVAGNDFDAVLDGIAIDSNGNGVYDAGIDPVQTAPASTASIAADAAQTIFVLLTIPSGIADGAQSEVTLAARAVTGSGAAGTVIAGAGEGGGDAVVGPSGASAEATGRLTGSASTVSLVKSAVVADPFGGTSAVPGAIITYSIAATVSGSAEATGLVISDAIPANTQYRANSLNLDAAPLSDAAGDDAGEASAAGITVNLGNVPGGTTRTISFAVTIDE